MIIDTDRLMTVANYARKVGFSMRWIYDCIVNPKHPMEGLLIDGVYFVIPNEEDLKKRGIEEQKKLKTHI